MFDYNEQDGYEGLIISHKESDRTRVGVFGGRTVSDALLIYCEGVISKGSNAFYPKADNSPFGYSMEPVDTDESSLKILYWLEDHILPNLAPLSLQNMLIINPDIILTRLRHIIN